MARKTRTTVDSTESLKENLSVKVKAEKMAHNNQENIAKKSDKKHAQARDDEEGNDRNVEINGNYANGDDDDDDDEDDGGGSPKGRKRSRANTLGDSTPTNGAAQPKYQVNVKPHHPRDTDGYVTGSIVRIQLENFVTYDYVEFRPGPYLNMIIGPNGTGKSSIACAIALGLNFPPKVLGRANELNLFVKKDTPNGYIEIELKGPRGKPNVTVRRHLFANKKSSTFLLNGSSASGNEVSQKMMELNVQVGNLCSFLPQDRVSEFAAMSPQQLLRETQRAAGNENLTNWHDTLISAGKELRQMEETIKSEQDQLKTMRDRNDAIEREVQRFNERKKIEHEIALLGVLIPVQRYREMRNEYLALKQEQRKMHEHVKRLKAKNAPAHALLEKLEKEVRDMEKSLERTKKNMQASVNKIQKKSHDSEEMENQMDRLNEQLDNLRKEQLERVNKIRRCEHELQKCRDELAKEVKMESEEDLREEMKLLKREQEPLTMKQDEVKTQMNYNFNHKARWDTEKQNAQNQLRRLENVDFQKLQNLQRINRDTYDALLWLRKNRNKFRMDIMEPALMSTTVNNKAYANAVESCFGLSHLLTFVPQCHEDYKLFNRLVQDDNVLGRKVRLYVWFREGAPIPQEPMSRAELAAENFDGYALDFLDFPEPLRYYFQVEMNLHRTAIAIRRPQAVNVDNAMRMVSRPETGGSANFITGDTIHQVSRSRYGRQAVQNLTKNVKQARTFVAGSVDAELKKKYEDQIQEADSKLGMAQEEHEKLMAMLADIEKQDAELIKRMDIIIKRREAIRKEAQRKVTLKSRITRQEAALSQMKNAPSADDERAKLKKKIFDCGKKRAAIAAEAAAMSRSIIKELQGYSRAGLEFLQVCANKSALKDLCAQKDEKYQKALAEFNRVDQAYQDSKRASTEALDESRAVVNDVEDDLQEEYRAIETVRIKYEKDCAAAEAANRTPPSSEGVDLRSLDELRAELESQEAQLEITMATNPGVVEQYEKRKRDIEILEKTVEERQKKITKVEKDIKTARDNWKPALEKLVASVGAKFSESFDRIGCAGEVHIGEAEDYERWTIDIMVKFRDEEKLQLLTGQRQSGGERSLSTILYIMSLNQEARAPFSLVDEINQGMDQRSERVVHNSLVDVTCMDNSAQYFLITPKLLPDLNYHERMKVLCVNNGEWLPEERGLGNMMNMIEGFVARRNRTAASA